MRSYMWKNDQTSRGGSAETLQPTAVAALMSASEMQAGFSVARHVIGGFGCVIAGLPHTVGDMTWLCLELVCVLGLT